MAKVAVSIVHDEAGQIISVARPSKGIKAIISSGDGHSVSEIQVEEGRIPELVSGNHRFDVSKKACVAYQDIEGKQEPAAS